MTAPSNIRRESRISEDLLQRAVVEMALSFRWKVCHFRSARKGDDSWAVPLQGSPGFVDLVLARKGSVLFVELKSDIGKLTRDQEEWKAALIPRVDAYHSYHIWRPADWLNGTIQIVLT